MTALLTFCDNVQAHKMAPVIQGCGKSV